MTSIREEEVVFNPLDAWESFKKLFLYLLNEIPEEINSWFLFYRKILNPFKILTDIKSIYKMCLPIVIYYYYFINSPSDNENELFSINEFMMNALKQKDRQISKLIFRIHDSL